MPRQKKPTRLPPIHPGEILQSEFLDAMKLSQNRLARDISVPPKRINEIVHGVRAITADTALRLARRFNTSPQFWMNLQMQYDIEIAQDALGNRLDREVLAPGRRKRASRRAAA